MSLFGSIGSVQSSDFSHGLFKVSSPPGGLTFSGNVGKNGIPVQWTFGTYSFFAGNAVNVFLPGDKEYDLRLSVVDSRQMIGQASISLIGVGLTGLCDMRDFEDYTGVVMNGNNITSVLFPKSDQQVRLLMFNNKLEGVVNLRDLSSLTGTIRFDSNPGLTGIYHTFSNQNIDVYYANNCGLTGSYDLSMFPNLGGDFRIQNNPSLTEIVHALTNRNFSIYYADNCNLVGVHDMSMITEFPTNFRIGVNPNMTNISHTFSNKVITEYWINNGGLQGVLDLTLFPNFKGGFFVSGNPGLTGIYHTASSQEFTYYISNECNLTGTHDLSMFPIFGGDFRIQNNPLLTEIVHTFSTVGFNQYNAAGCSLVSPRVDMLSNLTTLDTGTLLWTWANNGMGVTAVNQLLVDIDTVSVTASVTKTINVSGTNAAPTSGPPDGVAAVTSLLSKGFTVITS